MTGPEPGTRRRALQKSAELASKSAAAAIKLAGAEDEDEETPTGSKTDASAKPKAEVEEALEEIPSNAIVDIWRVRPDGTQAWCAQLDARDFSLAEIGRRLGGGRYKGVFRVPSTRPGYKYDLAGKRFVDVDPSVKPSPDVLGPAAAPAAAPATGLPDLTKFLEGFGEMVKAQIASSLEAQGRVTEMQGSLVTKMAELAKPAQAESPMERLLTALLPKLLEKPAPPADQLGVRDVLELMKEFRERPQAAGGELERALTLMTKMREAFAEEGNSGPAWLGPVEKGLGIIQDAMARKESGGKPMPVERPAAPALGPAPAAEVSRETPPAAEGGAAAVPEHPLLKLLAPYVPQLIGHATADHDPDLWAGVMLEMIPPGYHGTVLELVSAADITEQFTAGFPSAAPFAAWFKEFFTAAKERLTPEAGQ